MDEAEKIYRALFKALIPSALKERFERAADLLSAGYTDAEKAEYHRLLKRTKDLEAAELAARYLKKSPLLILRFRIMVSLAETWPENRRHYINNSDAPLAGWAFLFWGGLRAGIKFIKGLFLLAATKHV